MLLASYWSRPFILFFGTIYPAFASYKSIRSNDASNYLYWMMYWTVFAFFTCFEFFADILFAFWMPFYYELKVLFVLWLLMPMTRGSTYFYMHVLHPFLSRNEKNIETYMCVCIDALYTQLIRLGAYCFSFISKVVVDTACNSQVHIVHTLQRAFSTNDVTDFAFVESAHNGFEIISDCETIGSNEMDDLCANIDKPAGSVIPSQPEPVTPPQPPAECDTGTQLCVPSQDHVMHEEHDMVLVRMRETARERAESPDCQQIGCRLRTRAKSYLTLPRGQRAAGRRGRRGKKQPSHTQADNE